MGAPIKVFSSYQTGAPALTGEVGKLDAILNACLVTGFNPQSITSITITGNVATATTSVAHGYLVYDTVLFSGANESFFNDAFTITEVPTTTSFKFACSTSLTSATGTISCKIAPLGWARTFTGTNKSVYQQTDIMGTRLCLQVDDTATLVASVAMYETMSTIDIGVGKSPTLYWCKSNQSTSAIRTWYLIGDSRCFYFMPIYSLSYPGIVLYTFGDIKSFREADPWACWLAGSTASNAYNNNPNSYINMINGTGATAGMYFARAYTFLGGVSPFGLACVNSTNPIGSLNNVLGYPPSVDGAVHLTPVYVIDFAGLKMYRGIAPGYYAPLENPNGIFPDLDRTLVYKGKTYLAIRSFSSSNNIGNIWFDITGPWR